MRSLKYTLLGIFVLYFQLIIAPHFALYSIIPNFLIAYLAFISINMKAKLLFPLVFFLSIALDIMYPPLLGLNTIVFLIIAFIVNKFHMNVNKNRFIIVSLSIFLLNFFYYSILFTYHALAAQLTAGFVFLFLFSILYNTLISILIVYALILSERFKITLNV